MKRVIEEFHKDSIKSKVEYEKNVSSIVSVSKTYILDTGALMWFAFKIGKSSSKGKRECSQGSGSTLYNCFRW